MPSADDYEEISTDDLVKVATLLHELLDQGMEPDDLRDFVNKVIYFNYWADQDLPS